MSVLPKPRGPAPAAPAMKPPRVPWTCASCRYFVGEDVGVCRRYAPRPKIVMEDPSRQTAGPLDHSWWAVWPGVAADDFCGEWRGKNP